jgi:arylsulfatase A-like enzyme
MLFSCLFLCPAIGMQAQTVIHPQFRKWPSPSMDRTVNTVCPVLAWPAEKKKGVTYDVRLSRDSTFGGGDVITGTAIPWTVYLPHRQLAAGRWYWQYRVHDGEWSAAERFRIAPDAPADFAPPVERLWAGIPASHPRLLAEDRKAFAAAVKGTADASAILRKAQSMLGGAAPDEKAGISTKQGNNEDERRKLALVASEHASNRVYYAIDAFCKAWVISGDERYARKAVDWAMAVAGWDPDGVSHANDFGDSRCMTAMALVFDTFHDRLTAAQRAALLRSIRARAGRFYRAWINNIDAKVLSNHVWQYILYYFLQTAVAVYGEEPDAGGWLRYAYELWLARAPVLGGGDGGWQEGTSYFRINMETLLGIPMFIRQYTGFDFLKGNEWYERNPYWMAYSFPAGSSSDGFGDDVEKHYAPGPDYLSYADALSRWTGSRMAAWYAGRIEKVEHLKLSDADLLRWFRMRYLQGIPRPAPLTADSLPAAMVFPGTGIADMHSDIADRSDDLMISLRSSPYGSYGHLLADQNTFNMLYGGQRLFYMSGYKVAMQDPHRLGWYKATRGHNGILIDGQGQPYNVEAYGYLRRWLNGSSISYVMGDASHAYSSKAEKQDAGLKHFYRHLLFLHPDILLVYDELEADHPAQWSWLAHSPYKINLDSSHGAFRAANEKGQAQVALYGARPLKWSLSDTFGVAAVNWLGREDEDGNLIAYKNDQWHVTAETVEKTPRMRFLAVFRVRPGAAGGEILPLAPDVNGELSIDGWTVRAELDASQPARLEAYNKENRVSFTSGDAMGKARLTEWRDGKNVSSEAGDSIPPAMQEIPADKKRLQAAGHKLQTKDKRPNILFAIADDQSYPYASAYGTTGVRTPAFDRVAHAGVLFDNAFAAAPQCSPSRAAILTGRNIWQLEEAGTHSSYFPKKFQVFTDVLERAGYTIGYTGKAWAPGNWKDAGWERNPVGPEYNTKKLTPPTTGISKIDYYANFVDFYEHRKKEEPFFFWYGANEPHRTYEKGTGRRAGIDIRQSFVPGFLPDDTTVRSDIADYALEIEWFDKQLGQMIDFLKEKGELENTIIVVTSDNGMPFPSAKANLMEYGSHVPLAICWPAQVRKEAVSDELVSLIDLAPTFLEAAGVGEMAGMTGKSLTDILSGAGEKTRRNYVLTGRERHSHSRPDDLGYPSRAIRTDSFLYIINFHPERWPAGDPAPGAAASHELPAGDFKPIGIGYGDIDDPSPTKLLMMTHRKDWPALFAAGFGRRAAGQLFDVRKDPACTKDLVMDKRYTTIARQMKDSLMSLLREQGDPRATGKGDIFESYPRFGLMRDWPGFKERGKYNPAFMEKKD